MNKNLITEEELQENLIQQQIMSCFENLATPKSFFLYAGAGSGKTYTLVEILKQLKKSYKSDLITKNKQIKVITYTNVATEEILQRVEQDSLFNISTIHSFCWDMICEFTQDIKEFIKNKLQDDIKKLKSQQETGRPASVAYQNRILEIEQKEKRLKDLDTVIRFNYNPDPKILIPGWDALSHQEVINITSYFISNKITFEKIVTNKFPIIFIDESQDTFSELIDSLIETEKNHSHFSLGLFGDTMQRIYLNGKSNLDDIIPDTWIKPEKQTNHRSLSRIIDLGNAIRKEVDSHQQKPKTDSPLGEIHLFLKQHDYPDKFGFEKEVCEKMAKITNDKDWNNDEKVKTFLLEHQMASIRDGFQELYSSLNVDKLATGLREGTLPELNFFAKYIAHLITAREKDNHHLVMNILQSYNLNFFQSNPNIESIRKIKELVESIFLSYKDTPNISFLEILTQIDSNNNFFEIPSRLKNILQLKQSQPITEIIKELEEDTQDKNMLGLAKFLDCPFKQIFNYNKYINNETSYTTHHNVKGLEFPRVMVILDDYNKRGRGGLSASYEKLFEVEKLSPTDIAKISAGEDSDLDRTRRLFYVTCTRAEKSLAVVAYTSNPESFKATAIKKGYFSEEEISIL